MVYLHSAIHQERWQYGRQRQGQKREEEAQTSKRKEDQELARSKKSDWGQYVSTSHVVSGEVQGVKFRYEATKVASSLGLAGMTKNQPNGSVYIDAEGDKLAIEKLLAWCRTGPSHASVTSVTYTERKPIGYRGFIVRDA